MPSKKFSSYKSLISVSLLSLSVGLLNTACGSTEAATKTATEASAPAADTPVVIPVSAPTIESASSQQHQPIDQKSEVSIDPEPDSEIDFGDAYMEQERHLYALPITAEAAGEESQPLSNNEAEADPSRPIDDAYIAEEERTEFFYTGTPAINTPLSEVRASLEQGMPYSKARALIISNGWEPIVDPTIDTTYDASLRNLHAMGYPEAEACSGSGLGFCSMAFAGKDGVVLGIILTTSSEEPNVWDWNVNTL